MTLIKWNRPTGSRSLNNLGFPSFNSLIDDVFNGTFAQNEFASFVPAVNVSESNESYHIEVSAPGFNKEDFKVEVENKTLIISGEHKSEKNEENKNFTRKEFNYGSFKRAFSLPETANIDVINAKYENGILALTIAKKEEAKVNTPKQITVS